MTLRNPKDFRLGTLRFTLGKIRGITISQFGSFPHIWMKVKNLSNHHLDDMLFVLPVGFHGWLELSKIPSSSAGWLLESKGLAHKMNTINAWLGVMGVSREQFFIRQENPLRMHDFGIACVDGKLAKIYFSPPHRLTRIVHVLWQHSFCQSIKSSS